MATEEPEEKNNPITLAPPPPRGTDIFGLDYMWKAAAVTADVTLQASALAVRAATAFQTQWLPAIAMPYIQRPKNYTNFHNENPLIAMPPLEKGESVGFLFSENNTRSYRYMRVDPDNNKPKRGVFLIAPAKDAPIELYVPHMRALKARGYYCVCIDLFGQGMSTRINGNIHVTHIDDFRMYNEGFLLAEKQIISSILADNPGIPYHLMGASTGGHVLTKGAAEELFKANALSASAPLIKPLLPPRWKNREFLVKLSARIKHSMDSQGMFNTGPEKPGHNIRRFLDPRTRQEFLDANIYTDNHPYFVPVCNLLNKFPYFTDGISKGWFHAMLASTQELETMPLHRLPETRFLLASRDAKVDNSAAITLMERIKTEAIHTKHALRIVNALHAFMEFPTPEVIRHHTRYVTLAHDDLDLLPVPTHQDLRRPLNQVHIAELRS